LRIARDVAEVKDLAAGQSELNNLKLAHDRIRPLQTPAGANAATSVHEYDQRAVPRVRLAPDRGVLVYGSPFGPTRKSTEEPVLLVSKLSEACGPLVLWHDNGGEPAVVVTPARPAKAVSTAFDVLGMDGAPGRGSDRCHCQDRLRT
jgi:hypothetical protein